jgi:hypothetical protein
LRDTVAERRKIEAEKRSDLGFTGGIRHQRFLSG